MDDQEIVSLYWARSEKAISETSAKYGRFCYRIAYNVLANKEDSEEAVSDTYLAAWNKMPPHRPGVLSAFLGKITRYIAITKWRSQNAKKRGGGEIILALEELDECIPGEGTPESDFLSKENTRRLNAFLDSLPETERTVFLRRYWFLDSIEEIASTLGFTQGKVKSILFRTRGKLRTELQKEAVL